MDITEMGVGVGLGAISIWATDAMYLIAAAIEPRIRRKHHTRRTRTERWLLRVVKDREERHKMGPVRRKLARRKGQHAKAKGKAHVRRGS